MRAPLARGQLGSDPSRIRHSKTNPDGTTVSIGYDSYGNLNGLTLSNGPSYSFDYDLEGHRKNAVVTNGFNSNSFSYDYDEIGNLISYLEKDSDGNVMAKVDAPTRGQMYSSLDQLLGFNLTYGNGSPIPFSFAYNKGAYNYYYYHYNAQGDVVAVTDSAGAVYRQYVYDPYGDVISLKDGSGNATVLRREQ